MSPDPADREPDPEHGAGQDTDAAWRAIVEHYGERADLPEEAPEEPRPVEPSPAPADQEVPEWEDDEDGFVPPPAPPVPRPTGLRGVAWVGLFGSPVVVLLSIILQIALPGWADLLLLVAFAGGFTYLVATMRKDADEGWDDGAVL